MFPRFTKPIFLLICIVGLIFLPMSDIFLYNQSMDSSVKDSIRVASEKVEHTDYHSSDISTFVNDYFIFYVPPPTYMVLNCRYPDDWNGFERYHNYYNYRILILKYNYIQFQNYFHQ